jgi:hypothetical protein
VSQQKGRSSIGSGDIEKQRRFTIHAVNERRDGMKVALVDGDSCTAFQTIERNLPKLLNLQRIGSGRAIPASRRDETSYAFTKFKGVAVA